MWNQRVERGHDSGPGRKHEDMRSGGTGDGAERLPDYLDTKQAAGLCNLSHQTLAQWRRAGCGPAFIKLGRAIRYKRTDVEAWIASKQRGGN
jgi:predicted DNA-binding transcriptional regulator AlpA